MKENKKPTGVESSFRSRTKARSGSERFNQILLDAIPHPAMLVHRDQTILAANHKAIEMGARVGGLCWRDFGHGECIPEEDKRFISEHGGNMPPAGTKCTFCLANEALATSKPTNNPRVHAFGQIWDVYWIPVEGDVYLHYAINITEREQAEEQLQSSLTEAKQKQAETLALIEGSRAVLRHREFKDAARAIFAACKNLVGATAGYVALLSKDEKTNELVFLDPGGYPCTVDPSLPMPMRGLRGKVYRLGAAAYENSFAQSEWVKNIPPGHVSLDNVLFAPLVVDEKTVGLLGLGNKPGGFTENDAGIASAFAELAAIALLNSRTLEALKGSEERNRMVVQTASDAVISADMHGNIASWNRAAQTAFGYSADEAVGKPIKILMPERFREAHEKGFSRLVLSREPKIIGKTVELAGLRKNGDEFPLELSLSMMQEGKEILFTAITRDITERKRSEELEIEGARLEAQITEHKKTEKEIIRLQRRNEMILNSAGEGIYGLDLEGKTTFVNPAASKLVGYEPAELIGKFQHALIHHTRPDGTPYPREKCPIYTALTDGSVHHVDDEVFWRKDGTSFPVEYTSTPTRNERGELTGAVVVFKDITERKRTEMELKQSLERLQKTLEGSVSTLALVAEMRDPYTAGHQRRVSQLCFTIAREMGLPKEQAEGLRIASYIHDIGKIAVPAEILSKPGRLSEHEFNIIKAHTQLAYDMLKGLEFPWPVAQIILQHHERLDGSGYPHGISGENLILEARILGVADVVEAMASHRPYRAALGIDKALLEILQKRVVLYDPKVVDVCLKLFTEKGFKLE